MTERLGDRRWLEVLHAHNAHRARAGGPLRRLRGEVAGRRLHGRLRERASRARLRDRHPARLHAPGRSATPTTPIRVRIGLHTGEAIKEADDFFGKAVIQAARIAAAGRGGEILVSSLVRQLTESSGEFTFGDTREIRLKGLAGLNQVCPVVW